VRSPNDFPWDFYVKPVHYKPLAVGYARTCVLGIEDRHFARVHCRFLPEFGLTGGVLHVHVRPRLSCSWLRDIAHVAQFAPAALHAQRASDLEDLLRLKRRIDAANAGLCR